MYMCKFRIECVHTAVRVGGRGGRARWFHYREQAGGQGPWMPLLTVLKYVEVGELHTIISGWRVFKIICACVTV